MTLGFKENKTTKLFSNSCAEIYRDPFNKLGYTIMA
jgi:hypothetical protein